MKKDQKYQSINQRIDQAIRHYRIPSRLDNESALNLVLSKIEGRQTAPNVISLPLWWKFAGAAAVLLLALFLHLLLATVTFEGGSQQVATVRLPDQSRVVIDHNSRLEFRKYFWNRQVSLKGSAYFEVEKGSRFVVSTTAGKVEVLGTRFSVKEDENRLEVACFEGKVKTSSHGNHQLVEAGTAVTMTDGKKTPVKISAEYPAYALFSRHYSNAELSAVVKDIDHFFGVETRLDIKTPRYFTGTLETGSLETALTIVTSSLQMNYQIGDKNQIRIYHSSN